LSPFAMARKKRAASGDQPPRRAQPKRRLSPPQPTRRNPSRKAAIDAMEYLPGRNAPAKKAKPKTKPKTKPREIAAGPAPPSIPSIPGMPAGDYGEITDVRYTPVPVPDIIIPALYGAWQVNPKHKMCILFDAVNPCRQFKRGQVYDEDLEDPFAEYNPNADEDPDVTDTDEGDAQPYAPIEYT